jgi:hypothetical protein
MVAAPFAYAAGSPYHQNHNSMNLFRIVLHVLIASLAVTSAVAHAATFDPAADFSLSGNPHGPWSYGYSQTLGGPLILHTNSGSGGGLDYWNTDVWIGLPWIVRNATTNPILWSGTATFEPGVLSLHPGAFGEVEVLRFTAPVAGSYRVYGAFFGQDSVGPTTSDVHILRDGTSIFDAAVSDFGTAHAFDTTLTLAAGSQLDFAVGLGFITTNIYDSNYYDSTGVSALITQVPAPDSDGDGITNARDDCPNTAPGAPVNATGCSIDQLVPCAGPASGGIWRNRGHFLAARLRVIQQFHREGLVDRDQVKVLIRAAVQSDCGSKHPRHSGATLRSPGVSR